MKIPPQCWGMEIQAISGRNTIELGGGNPCDFGEEYPPTHFGVWKSAILDGKLCQISSVGFWMSKSSHASIRGRVGVAGVGHFPLFGGLKETQSNTFWPFWG